MTTKNRQHNIKFDIIYDSHLSTHEVEPMIGVSCSLVKRPKIGYNTTDVEWSSKGDTDSSSSRHFFGDDSSLTSKEVHRLRSKPMSLSVKFDAPPPWPRDASVWFQVYAKMTSSEGKLRFEKAGAGVLHLADLVPASKGEKTIHDSVKESVFGHRHHPSVVRKHAGGKKLMVVKIPLTLQSMRLMKDEPVIKGFITIRAPMLSPDHFGPPSKYDLVPANMQFLEASMMTLIKKNMAVFDKKTNAKMSGTFDPMSNEIQKVHAPLYITAQGVLPGEYYWANLEGEKDYDEEVYLSIAKTILERHRINQTWFLNTVREMTIASASSSTTTTTTTKTRKFTYKTDVHGKAVALFGEMTSAMSTTLAYIADYADLNDDRAGRHRFQKQKGHITVESFDDAMMRHADDCEGLARLNARSFMGFRDGRFSHPLLKDGVQVIARMYVGAGTLGSVTSRNIAEAENDGSPIQINSDIDQSADIGAHMWFSLIPKRHFLKMVGRTSHSTRDKIALGDGSTLKTRPKFESKLPVMVSEGTGMIKPTLLAVDAYHDTIESKKMAVNTELYEREAYIRLMTDRTLIEIESGSARPDPPGELGRLQCIRSQQALLSDPNARVSPFYRVWSAIFPVVEPHDDVKWQEKKAEGVLPDSWNTNITDPTFGVPVKASLREDFEKRIGMKNDDDDGDGDDDEKAPVYSWRYVVPVQITKRPDSYEGKEKDIEYIQSSETQYPLQWGTHTADMLHKRPFVGIVRMGSATSEQEKIISSYARHLPPQAEIKAPTLGQRQAFKRHIEEYNTIIRNVAFSGKNAISDKDFFEDEHNSVTIESKKHGLLHLAQLYIKYEDSSKKQITKVAKRIKTCPYAVDARAVGEMFNPKLANVRIDVMVSITNPAQLGENVQFLFDGQA